MNSHEWHNLFPSGDGRHALTWAGRFSNLRNTDVYNFYSRGEEVLRTTESDPPSGLLSALGVTVSVYLLTRTPLAAYVWVWGEKAKGRAASDDFLGTTHGGWKFNYYPPYLYVDGGLPSFMSPAMAAQLPDSQLMTNAFFNLSSDVFTADTALYGQNASSYAQANRDRILSDAIPALTLPAGANPVSLLATTRNFDMQASFETGWASGRGIVQVGAAASGEWHHSDYLQVAYTYTHTLFYEIVRDANLK